MSEQDSTPTLDDDDMLDTPVDDEDEDFDDGDVDLDEEPLPFGDDVLVQTFVPDELDGNGNMGFEDEDRLLPEMPLTMPVAMPEERITRLEEAARVLAEQLEAREQRRVRRKVQASTAGAGAGAFVPILLGLVGTLDLPTNLAATATAAASLVGALLAGYFTPERERPVSSSPAAQDLLDEAAELSGDVPAGGSARAHRRRHRTRRQAHRHR